MLLLIFPISLLPPVAMYFFLRNRKKEDGTYRLLCSKALKRGAFLCPVLVLLFSGVCYLGQLLLMKAGLSELGCAMYSDFILCSFSEELMKYLLFKDLMKKNSYAYSKLDAISLMMVVGIGFGLIESVVYAFGANAGMMLTRGFTAMHCGYGFILGYFAAKGLKTDRRGYLWMGFTITFLLHGTYDFCLSDELGKINENFALISLALAVVSILTLIISILYIRRGRGKSEYEEPLRAESLKPEV